MRLFGLRARLVVALLFGPVLFGVVVFGLGGCGGVSARARLVASADRVCAGLNARLNQTAVSVRSSHAVLARNASEHAAIERQAITRLAGLRPPVDLAHDWARLLSDRRQLVTQLLALAHAWASNDQPVIKQLAASKVRLHRKIKALAARDGFKDCSRVGPPI